MSTTPEPRRRIVDRIRAGTWSPLLALGLGLLTRSVRTGVRHVAIVLLWVTLFLLASYFVENDFVIWTPLALYLLHAALLLVLIALGVVRRSGRKKQGD